MMNKLAAALLALTACAAENDGALHLSGNLAESSKVTHVVATNSTTGERIVVDMKSDGERDGRFDIALPAGDGAWIVTFADANKKGAAMRVATLQSAGIDAFWANEGGGAIDFGTVNFDGRFAHGTVTMKRLESELGASAETLARLAKTDNLALRYANPDVDNNGELDALEGHAYRLDLQGTFRLQTGGRDVTIADLVSGLGNVTMQYQGTTISAAVPRAMGMDMSTGTVTFDQPFYGTVFGDSTQMVEAGTKIGQPHIKFGERDGMPLVGVVANSERSAPSGNYRFAFANGQLTFTDVFAPSVASLSAPTEYAIPFVRIRSTETGCKTDCDIGALELEWKRMTSFGWETVAAPRDAHIDLVTRFQGKDKYLAADLTDGATSINWADMPLANTGLVHNELSYISTGDICYLAVSYTSELGMKMTGQVQNEGCR